MNWQALVAELNALNMTQPQIAEACACAQTTISAIATGKTVEPKHSLGEALKALLAARQAEALTGDRPAGADTGERRRSTDNGGRVAAVGT